MKLSKHPKLSWLVALKTSPLTPDADHVGDQEVLLEPEVPGLIREGAVLPPLVQNARRNSFGPKPHRLASKIVYGRPDPRVMSDEKRRSQGRPRIPENTIRFRSSLAVGCRGKSAIFRFALGRPGSRG
jgi:hypothetical protein